MSHLTLHKEKLLDWLQRPGCHISEILEFARQEYLDDPDILLQAVQKASQALRYATPRLQNDPKIVLAAVQQDGLALQYASPELQDHQPTVMAALRNDAQALQYANSRLKTDKEVVLAAVTLDGAVLQYASSELKNNTDVVLTAVTQVGTALRYAGEVPCNDAEVVLAAVRSTGLALEYASPTRRNDKSVVLAAIQNRYRALQYASDELRNDRDLVLAAVEQDDWALSYASPERQNDKDMVLAAAKKNGETLGHSHINPRFRQDRDIILAAVQQNGMALQYASEELRDDKDIVVIAVTESGRSLQYASQRLKADRAVVVVAVQNSDQALQFASKELQQDTELTVIAAPRDDRGSKSPNPESKDSEFDASFLSFLRSSTLQSVINPQAGQIRDLKDQVAHLQEICDQLQQQFRTFIETSDSKELTEPGPEKLEGQKRQLVQDRPAMLPDETPVQDRSTSNIEPPQVLLQSSHERPVTVDEHGELRNPYVSDELHRQQGWCTRYYKEHRDDIPPGGYITVIYPIQEVKHFKTYKDAIRFIRRTPKDTGVLVTEHPMEDYHEIVCLTVEGRFEGNPKMAYIDAKIRETDESKEIELPRMLIDTGASACFLPQSFCTTNNLRTLGRPSEVNKSTQPIPATRQVAQRVDIELSVDGLPYVDVATGYLVNSETKLLGLSFLELCQQRWRGRELVQIEFLEDVKMGEANDQSMQLDVVNAHRLIPR